MTSDVDRSDPHGSHRFRVEIDSIVVAGFSEVRGLSTTVNQVPPDGVDGADAQENAEGTAETGDSGGPGDAEAGAGSRLNYGPVVSQTPGIAAEVPQWQGILGGALPWIGQSGDVSSGKEKNDDAEGGDGAERGEGVEGSEQDDDGDSTSLGAGNGPTLKLRRGIADEGELWDWFRRCRDGTGQPRDVRVILLDSRGREVRGWVCREAHPIRWDGPTLVAADSGVATETFELAHEGIQRIELGE